MKIRSDIPPSVFRVFVAVLALCEAGRHSVSVRAVAKRLGRTSPNGVRPQLLQLKALGWIEYQSHEGQTPVAGSSGTIRPLRRLELIEA